MGRVFCLCPPKGRWWRSFFCKAPIPPAKASPTSFNAEHGPRYPTCTENMGTWWSMRYETCDWLSIRSSGVNSTYVAEHDWLISARSSGWSHLFHLQNSNRYKLVINWCYRSPPRSVFGTTSTTMLIFRNTHEAKTPVHARMEFPIHFLGRLLH